MDRGSWWAAVHGVAKSRIGLSMHMILESNQPRACMLCMSPRAVTAKHQRLGAENTETHSLTVWRPEVRGQGVGRADSF